MAVLLLLQMSLAIQLIAVGMIVLAVLVERTALILAGICVNLLAIFLNVIAMSINPEDILPRVRQWVADGLSPARTAQRNATLPQFRR
ncbi:TPA_asm: ORFX protein [Eleocharis dulcis waikavirus]|uniref:ORFX protein n=1 Tax=Eleocharis dulcis waikavirus TaxID=3027339 RepID=A0AA48SG58_9SECO|nr:TPA_asm: ORFX protein [Eleocharis dulcis waikavirus]